MLNKLNKLFYRLDHVRNIYDLNKDMQRIWEVEDELLYSKFSGNSYTGGQYYYLTSLETNIDFNLDAFDITSTLFIDVGSVWGLENPAYSDIEDEHNLRSSAGINLNWDTATLTFIILEHSW